MRSHFLPPPSPSFPTQLFIITSFSPPLLFYCLIIIFLNQKRKNPVEAVTKRYLLHSKKRYFYWGMSFHFLSLLLFFVLPFFPSKYCFAEDSSASGTPYRPKVQLQFHLHFTAGNFKQIFLISNLQYKADKKGKKKKNIFSFVFAFSFWWTNL